MSIPSWAVKGAKVVCVSADPCGMLVLNKAYTVAGVKDGFVSVEGVFYSGGLAFWFFSRFRPMTSGKTQAEDVAMIKDLIGIKTEERV